MAENSVLSVALEGPIDQVQYSDRIKAIVEFLGPRLAREEISKMWRLQDSANAHVVENVHAIMAGASAKFSLSQLEHLTGLIRESWESKTNDRAREKLLGLIGQIGKEATQSKSTQAILQLLWEVSHLHQLPKHLVEQALKEHLSILTEMSYNRDAVKRTYVFKCVDNIKKNRNVLPSVIHLHNICKSYIKGTSIYQKADKATLGELNQQHEIVKLLSLSMRSCHEMSQAEAERQNVEISSEILFDDRHTHEEMVEAHLALMKFFLKEGDLFLSWGRCKELWDTLVDNPHATTVDKEKIFTWFDDCVTDLETHIQRQLFVTKLMEMKPCQVTQSSFHCFKTFFESINTAEGGLKKNYPHFVSQLNL